MKKTKKLVALSLAVAMVMSSSVTAFAAESLNRETESPATGSSVTEGDTMGYVDKNIFTVEVTADQSYSFKLDPQELKLAAHKENAPTVDGEAMAEGYGANVLFVDGDNYKTKSDAYQVANLSTMPVSVTATAKITGLTGAAAEDAYDVKVVEDVSGETATAISMTLSQTAGTMKDEVFATGDAASVTTALTDATAGAVASCTIATIDNLDDAYEVSETAADVFSYAIKDDVSDVTFEAVSFSLSGKVNTEADWKNFDKANAKLKVEVVYSIKTADVTAEEAECFAYDDGYAVYIALSPFNTETGEAPTPGFEDATPSDVTNLTINGKSVTPVIYAGYISLAYNLFTGLTPPYEITFTYNGVNYSVTLES